MPIFFRAITAVVWTLSGRSEAPAAYPGKNFLMCLMLAGCPTFPRAFKAREISSVLDLLSASPAKPWSSWKKKTNLLSSIPALIYTPFHSLCLRLDFDNFSLFNSLILFYFLNSFFMFMNRTFYSWKYSQESCYEQLLHHYALNLSSKILKDKING